MNIRKAFSSDAPEIASVHIKSWQTTYKGIVSDVYLSALSFKKSEQQWRERLNENNKNIFTYVAENKPGTLIGFALGGLEQFEREQKGVKNEIYKGELMAIYLLKEHQRKGIGRQLAFKIITHLVENDINSMITWVLKENLSFKFYQALGGIIVGERLIEIGAVNYIECAYGWDNLSIIPFK